MRIPTRVFEPNVFYLRSLDQQHAEICLAYQELEEAILLGQKMPGIVEAADRLVEMILQHFGREEKFLGRFSLAMLERQRAANIEVTLQLFEIEDGLREQKAAAVFQLLLLGHDWLKEHMQREQVEFDGPFPGKSLHVISA
jgi:hemerythrin-like metal-binding protein